MPPTDSIASHPSQPSSGKSIAGQDAAAAAGEAPSALDAPQIDAPSINPPTTDPTPEPFGVKFAPRVDRLPPYMFGRINSLLYQKRRAGDDVIDLGMGNPSDPPDPVVIEKLAAAAADPGNHGYSKSNGITNLRRELAGKYYRKYGVNLDPESEIIACLGSKEGFSHMCLALMGAGDTAIIPSPYFPVHMYGVILASGNVVQLDVSDPEKFLRNVAYTCENMEPRPKVLIVNYPHNPTSAVIEVDFFVDVVRLAKKYGFLVIHDFAYADVAFDGYQPPSFLSAPGAKDVGVEFTTMSKGYNMAGWRVGFCAGNAEMVRGLGVIKGYYDYGMFQAIQIAAIVAMRETEATVKKQSEIYQGRRDALVAGLRRLGWELTPPKAGMFVWAKVPDEHLQTMSTMDFAMKLLEEGNVAVSPGSGFGAGGEGYLRMSLVENEQRLRQAVRQIGKAIKS
ncbi:MAG: aminotransferase class I/II-fold pyridoxal phosphate-dependent enzyme [Planctomycetota bacterium]